MVTGDRLYDRQPKANPTGGSGARTVSPPEAGEDPSDRIPRDADALVLDLDDDLAVASPPSAQLDGGVLTSEYLTALSSRASRAVRKRSGSTWTVPLTTAPSRQLRGATSHQRMKTSSRKDSISIGSSRRNPGCPAVASSNS